jgi:hypothetical protein
MLFFQSPYHHLSTITNPSTMFPVFILALALPWFRVAGHEEGNISMSTIETIVTRTTTVTASITAKWTNSTAPLFNYTATSSAVLKNSTHSVLFSIITTDVTQTTIIFVSLSTSSSSHSSSLSASSGKATASGKRGLAYNDAKYTKNFGGPNSPITWQYNWNSQPYAPNNLSFGMMNPSLKFLPQLWSLAEDLTTHWHTAATIAIDKHGADALMAYNEPDCCTPGAGSACMLDIPAAVQGYKNMMSPYYKTNIKLGMPAVTNGDTGIPWAQKFLELCKDCQIDFAPMHFYTDPQAPFEYFTGYVKNFTEVVKPRKVWITEFALNKGTDEQNAAFLKKAMEWLDKNEDVERYAYFWAGPKSLCNEDGSLTVLGKLYNE